MYRQKKRVEAATRLNLLAATFFGALSIFCSSLRAESQGTNILSYRFDGTFAVEYEHGFLDPQGGAGSSMYALAGGISVRSVSEEFDAEITLIQLAVGKRWYFRKQGKLHGRYVGVAAHFFGIEFQESGYPADFATMTGGSAVIGYRGNWGIPGKEVLTTYAEIGGLVAGEKQLLSGTRMGAFGGSRVAIGLGIGFRW